MDVIGSGARRSNIPIYDDLGVVVDTRPFGHKPGLFQHTAGSYILDRYHAKEGQRVGFGQPEVYQCTGDFGRQSLAPVRPHKAIENLDLVGTL